MFIAYLVELKWRPPVKRSNGWDLKSWSVGAEESTDPSLPLVTIGILNYNRCEDLRRTLDVIFRGVIYPRVEVIVVDNGSSDGSVEMIRAEFPKAKLHEVGWNAGTSSRNWEMRLATGKYIFSFDDDTIPATPATILRMVKYMESHENIDALVSTYYQPIAGFDETGEDPWFRFGGNGVEGFEGIYLAEGGTCFRVSSLRAVDGYDERIICYREGYDLALQLYKAGYGIRFCPWFVTLHLKSPSMRVSGRFAFLNAQHHIWIIAKHWPLLLVPPMLSLWLLRRVLGAIIHPSVAQASMKGVMSGLRGVRPFLRYRPKLSLKQLILLKRFYIQLYRW